MIATGASSPSARPMRQRARRGAEAGDAEDFTSLSAAREAVQACTRCPLYRDATQAVFGAGAAHAKVMMVGEQPGDSEDLVGKPFVGPAGKLFDVVLEAVRIDREKLYVTNAVKHFKFVPRGKRRLHQTPNAGEVSACRFWLDREIALVKPGVIVALGATAARSLVGAGATISKLRGAPLAREDGRVVFVTVHPSYLLRLPNRAKAAAERSAFARDLAMIRAYAESELGHSVALDRPGADP